MGIGGNGIFDNDWIDNFDDILEDEEDSIGGDRYARSPPPPPPPPRDDWSRHRESWRQKAKDAGFRYPEDRPPPPPRDHWRPPPPPPPPRREDNSREVLGFGAGATLTKEQVKDRRRELAKKHHPDRGGSVETMQRINAAADVLLAELEGRSTRW